MITLFKRLPDWSRKAEASGHVTFVSKVTGGSIGFSGHNNSTLSSQVKKDHLYNVQLYLNILHNELFYGKGWRRWGDDLKMKHALQKYEAWINAGKPIEDIKTHVEATIDQVNCLPRH